MESVETLKKLVTESLPEVAEDNALVAVQDENALLSWLATRINDLILHHFEKLLFLLYRIDIEEDKVKKMLSDRKNENAGWIIAELILQRQKEKLAWREKFKNYKPEGLEEEMW